MIQVENLVKLYGDVAAVNGVTFTVEKGEILGFLGPNAAGKTTTMRIITGFMPPTSGKVTVAGFDIVEESLEARERIGYLPENVPLYEEMTVRGYLTFCAKLRGVGKKKIADRVHHVMQATHTSGEADTIVSKLSKGFRQRVGIAQAMVHNPDVLILDEPTVGLDPRQIIDVRALIRSLKGEHTIILSTHILPEAQMLCDRIVIINEGKVAAIDTPDALTARLRRSRQIRLEVRGPAGLEERLAALPGVMNVRAESRNGTAHLVIDGDVETDVRESVAHAVVQGGWGLLEMSSVTMSLEDIFLRLTTEEDAPSPGLHAPGRENSGDRAEQTADAVTPSPEPGARSESGATL
jgi:ABC-2 type transport system ATP-binding protein